MMMINHASPNRRNADDTQRTNEPFISGSTVNLKRDKHNSRNSHLNYALRTKNYNYEHFYHLN